MRTAPGVFNEHHIPKSPFQIEGMLSTAIIFGLMATASAFCGAPPASESFKAVHAMYANVSISAGITPRASKPFVAFKPTVTINTYVHVIYSGSNPKTATGNIPDTKIRAQIAVLNKAFGNSGFQFKLAGTTRHNDKAAQAWLNLKDKSKQELQMKTTLRNRGTSKDPNAYKDLNIYFTTLQDKTRSGWAYFPGNPNPKGFDTDGIVLRPNVAQGDGNVDYPGSKVIVHEAGHWFGLLHTFEATDKIHPDDGCFGDGDLIKDTPPEKSPNTGCPANRHSCSPRLADPIHNYMDYTNSECMREFTNGQIARMQAMWLLYRANYDGPYENGVDEVEDAHNKIGFWKF